MFDSQYIPLRRSPYHVLVATVVPSFPVRNRKSSHQHSDGPNQHAQPGAQRAAEHQTGAERKQRARDEANGGEHIHGGEGNGAQSGVVLDPLQEALEDVGDETQSGNLREGNEDTAVSYYGI